MLDRNRKVFLRQHFEKLGYTNCKRCGRILTDPDSMLRRHGLSCYNKLFKKPLNQLKLKL